MKRGKRENLMGTPPPPPKKKKKKKKKKKEKNDKWPKVTYSAISTTPNMALSSNFFFNEGLGEDVCTLLLYGAVLQ
jgi:hypothetical protein